MTLSRGLHVDIDPESVRAMANAVGATDKQVEAAFRSTYSKMGRWLRTRAVRGLSAKLGIKQKVLRNRVKGFRLEGGITAHGNLGTKVWFGLRPISMMRLNAKEVKGGVRASGGRFVEGAFIAKIHGHEQVLIRKGKPRLPIKVVYVDIHDESITYIEDELVGTAEFDNQFFKYLEHELRWRTQILN